MNYEITELQAFQLNLMAEVVYDSCVQAGWYTDLVTGERKERNVGEQIALMHSELSEALEGHRGNLMDKHLPHRKNVEVELADAVIRIMDFCGYHGYDLGGALQEKFAYNQERADHKMANRQKEGGKSI